MSERSSGVAFRIDQGRPSLNVGWAVEDEDDGSAFGDVFFFPPCLFCVLWGNRDEKRSAAETFSKNMFGVD